ncbi:MAG: hypothetical protein J6K42_01805 [Clostridia bacterium]|nr:hypothetical protein [Clostridia bacterium]
MFYYIFKLTISQIEFRGRRLRSYRNLRPRFSVPKKFIFKNSSLSNV